MTEARVPTIDRLRVRTALVPLPEPHKTASGTLVASPLVLLDLTDSEGNTGHAIVLTYAEAALGPTAALIANLEPLVAGLPLDPPDVSAQLSRQFRLLGNEGLIAMAIAGIDMAMWDALARGRGLSIVDLQGRTPRSFPAYGVIGFDGPAGSAATAEAWVKRGFTGVKARVGYPTVEEDRDVVRAIRAAVGPDVAIMVDYNQSLRTAEAMRRLAILDEEKLAWVEEPTLAQDFLGHARIADAASTPIQSGENWWGPLGLQHALAARASDLVMPDAMKVGGVSGWLEAAALGEAHGVPVSTHLWPELNAQLLCLAPTAHWLEYNEWWTAIIADPLEIRDGMTALDQVRGSGIAWNENAVARFAA